MDFSHQPPRSRWHVSPASENKHWLMKRRSRCTCVLVLVVHPHSVVEQLKKKHKKKNIISNICHRKRVKFGFIRQLIPYCISNDKYLQNEFLDMWIRFQNNSTVIPKKKKTCHKKSNVGYEHGWIQWIREKSDSNWAYLCWHATEISSYKAQKSDAQSFVCTIRTILFYCSRGRFISCLLDMKRLLEVERPLHYDAWPLHFFILQLEQKVKENNEDQTMCSFRKKTLGGAAATQHTAKTWWRDLKSDEKQFFV